MRGKYVVWAAVAAAFASASPVRARASLTVLVSEPFGNFGTMMPVGHVSLYLDRVCADGPIKLRMCGPNELQGVTIARLDKIGRLDWINSPILDFLYGTDHPEEILPFATEQQVTELRDQYRREHLREFFPDGTENVKHNREWWETVGVLYSRKVFGYELATTRAQDEAFVARMNADPNVHAYHLHKTNCADFVADAVNFFYPGAVRSDHVADYALMTPKQVGRAVDAYGAAHPEFKPHATTYAQIPGTLRRSRPARGGAEMILKTKRYLAIMSVIQPELVVTVTALYLTHGRWELGRGAEERSPAVVIAGVRGTSQMQMAVMDSKTDGPVSMSDLAVEMRTEY